MGNKVHPLVLLFKLWAVSSTRSCVNSRLCERLCVLVAVRAAQCVVGPNYELLKIMIVNNQKESKDGVWWYFQVVPPKNTTSPPMASMISDLRLPSWPQSTAPWPIRGKKERKNIYIVPF